MKKATKKGVSRQLGVKVVEISNKYYVFLGPADGDVKQFRPSILRASSLGEPLTYRSPRLSGMSIIIAVFSSP